MLCITRSHRSVVLALTFVCAAPAEAQLLAIVNANVVDGVSEVPLRSNEELNLTALASCALLMGRRSLTPPR